MNYIRIYGKKILKTGHRRGFFICFTLYNRELANFITLKFFGNFYLQSYERGQPCICILRWPTTVTSKPNAHSKLKIAHIKFKSLTSNSNRSHQIQIAHIKFKSLTANSNRSQQITNRSHQIQISRSHQIQIAHSKFKSLTANSNRSQQFTNRSHQIQIAHIKLQIINSARRLRLSTASGATRLKIFVIHEAATL